MPSKTVDDSAYFDRNERGILVPKVGVRHRNDEYDDLGFDQLREMQTQHFWYVGRHRFLLYSLKKMLRRFGPNSTADRLSMIDLGGGCGGWIHYLVDRSCYPDAELALADSSVRALEYAADFVGPSVERFQVDLLQLPWENRWDAVFLLDVLEHIPDHEEALRQAYKILRPGGLLFATMPALQFFWTYNDELAQHVRRYSKKDLVTLAESTGFELRLSRYFMFLLSPLLYLSRRTPSGYEAMDTESRKALQIQSHRVPAAPVNAILKTIFSLETPAGVWMPFPWGSSVLGVFQKKA